MHNVIETNSFVAQRIAARYFLIMNHYIANQLERSNAAKYNKLQQLQTEVLSTDLVTYE